MIPTIKRDEKISVAPNVTILIRIKNGVKSITTAVVNKSLNLFIDGRVSTNESLVSKSFCWS
jgi:hypothetical protein